MMQSLIYPTLMVVLMTKYNNTSEDRHFAAIEDAYYRELDEAYAYELALEQYARGEIACTPEQPFLVML